VGSPVGAAGPGRQAAGTAPVTGHILGAVTLPANGLAKLDSGRRLTEEEAEMVDRVPDIWRTTRRRAASAA
jgi:hypothetical protein